MLVVAGTAALAYVQAGTGAESASRIVDRTLLCRMTGVGYPDPARILRVGAATHNPDTSDFPSSLHLSNGGAGTGTSVGVTAGITDRPYSGSLSHGKTACSVSTLRVPLSRRSLSGGPVPFYRSYDCDVPARIVVRVQAIFERPPRALPWGTVGDLVQGTIAVATSLDRKPVAFASIAGGSGQIKVFVSRSLCKEDS